MTSPRWTTATTLGCLIACALAAGCGGSDYDLVPISGTVTLDGAPLAGGVINFQPFAPAGATTGGPGSTARIGSDGRFELATVQGAPGAVLGQHQVKIYSYSPESPVASDSDAGPPQERVPPKYNYRSELTFDVPAGGSDQANFALTSDGK